MSKISWETLSATSRRGAPTSRRQNYISLPRRDMDFPRHDVILTLLCHIAMCIFTSRRQIVKPSVTSRRVFSRRNVILHESLSRRDVIPHVATWIEPTLCHVATLPSTSRCCLVKLSVTSRRRPARRDVTLFLAQEWFILALHLTHLHSSDAYQPSLDLSELPSHRSETLHCSPATSVPF